MIQILNFKQNFWKISILILGIVLVLSLGANFILLKKNSPKKNPNNLQASLEANINKTEKVSAEEIYPLFFCPCCGQPLDKNNICCGAAKERIDYIDGLVDAEISEDKVILAYVRKYGLDSFMDEEKQKEFQEKLVKNAPENRPIISLSSEVYDFGNVSQKEGIATTLFEIRNNGKTDLVINRLETSCGCTSTSIIYQNEESPRFNMPGHGINEEIGDWQVLIAPNETAQLKVYYDPNVHSDFRGTAIRDVYIYSNDPIEFQKKVQIELNQVD